MTTREKVGLAVSHCLRSNDCSICEACPYNEGTDYGCRARLRDDIIALLKAQEPIETQFVQDANGAYAACGKCNHKLWKLFGAEFTVAPSEMPRFCSSCGQAVKWK